MFTVKYNRNRLAQITMHAEMAAANERQRERENARVFGTAPAAPTLGKPAPALPGR